MSQEGRLARGKENYSRGKFLNNSETLEYIATLPKAKPVEAKKNAKPAK